MFLESPTFQRSVSVTDIYSYSKPICNRTRKWRQSSVSMEKSDNSDPLRHFANAFVLLFQLIITSIETALPIPTKCLSNSLCYSFFSNSLNATFLPLILYLLMVLYIRVHSFGIVVLFVFVAISTNCKKKVRVNNISFTFHT